MSNWQNRIVGYSEEPVDQLLASPLNWRIHPKAQADALLGVLSEVGIVQNVLANRTTQRIIDGHLRISLALQKGQATVPVTWVDLSEEEEALILATLDPIGALAATDGEKLDELLRGISTDSIPINQMLNNLAESAGLFKRGERETSLAADTAQAASARWDVQEGQLWLIDGGAGRVHRVLCGDNTDPAAIARLCSDSYPEIVITDPPYELPAADVMTALDAIKVSRACVLSAGAQAFSLQIPPWVVKLDFVWQHQPRTIPAFNQPVHYHNNFLVLATEDGLISEEDLTPDYEYLIVLARGDAKVQWRRPTKGFGSIIKLQGPDYVSTAHGHGKSAELFQKLIRGFPFKVWGDPYVGSGATLLACEAEGRTMLAMDKSPQAIAALLDRCSTAGLLPRLAHPTD